MHTPSSGSQHKNHIVLGGVMQKVKSLMTTLGILSAPLATAKTPENTSTDPLISRLEFAERLNRDGIRSYQELENTIEYTWSQLKNTPKAPKEIRDKYGHITIEGLVWLESELPAEYLRRAQKYKNMERELEKMDKKDPKYGVWEYSLICLGALLIGIIGYKFGKVSKKEIERLKNESDMAHDEAEKHMRERAFAEGRNMVLEAKIAAMEKALGKSWKETGVVDAEIIEPGKSPSSPTLELPYKEIPEGLKDTFLATPEYQDIRDTLIDDISSETPSAEGIKLKESIQALKNTGTSLEQAKSLNMMSRELIAFARHKKTPEENINTLLRSLEKSFQEKEYYFGRPPVTGESFDTYTMTRVGKTNALVFKVAKVNSLPVIHNHITVVKSEVECQ